MQLDQPIKMILGLLPAGAVAALVVWFVYVGQYGKEGNSPDEKQRTRSEKATIAFQAIIASVAVYYALHHHLTHMM
jgi:hypothetical protein